LRESSGGDDWRDTRQVAVATSRGRFWKEVARLKFAWKGLWQVEQAASDVAGFHWRQQHMERRGRECCLNEWSTRRRSAGDGKDDV